MKNQVAFSACCNQSKKALIITAFACLAQSLQADTHTWDGSTSGYWSTGANWTSGAAPVNGDDLVFPSGAAHLANTNNVLARVNSITISGANYALRGNSITLSNGVTATYAGGSSSSVDLDIALGAGQTFECGADNSILYVTGDIALGAYTLLADAPGNILLGGAISGSGGISKYGGGYLRLYGSAANTFTGLTRVNVGRLEFDKASSVNAISGDLIVGNNTGDPETARWLNSAQLPGATDVTVNDGAVLDLNNFNEALGALTLSGGEVQTGAGLLSLGGNVTAGSTTNHTARIYGRLSLGSFTRTFYVSGGPMGPHLHVFAEISGTGGILKTGASIMALQGTNTYSGLTTVAEGNLHIWDNGTPGNTNAGTIVENGAALQLFRAHVRDEALTIQGSGPHSYGALKDDWSGCSTSSWSGPIALAADATISVDDTNLLTLSGPISGPGGIIKRGTATLVLSGSSGNTFAGDTVVNEGTLLLDKSVTDGALPGPGELIIGDGSGGYEADVVRELHNYQIDGSVDITVNVSGLLDINDHSDTVGGLSLSSGHIQTGIGLLTLGGDVLATSVTNMPAVIDGRVSVGSGTRTFNVLAGVWSPDLYIPAQVSGSADILVTGLINSGLMLAGSNTFTGTLTAADAALLWVHDNWALGSTNAGTVISDSAYLGFPGDVHVQAEPLTMNSTYSAGAFWVSAGSNSWAGPVILDRETSVHFNSDAANSLNFAGPISGAGGLTKRGIGTLILSGATANTYAGSTYVRTGPLVLDKSAPDGAVPGSLIIGDGTGGAGADVVRLARANQIANAAAVTVSASGLFDLDGHYDRVDAVTGSGLIMLGSGHLIAGHSDSSFTFDGLVSGSGYLWKVGDGAWTLTGNNTYTGTTRIEIGTLLVNGSQPQSDVDILAAGLLGGTGAVGRITSTGGAIAPGASPGTLTSSNLLFDSASDFIVELGNPISDQLNVHGKAALANALLVLSAPGLLPTEGQEFVILNNDDTDAITGAFSGVAEGALVNAGPRQFRISYHGGTGNDVVLTATNTAALWPELSIWHTDTNTVVVSWPQSDIAWLLHATTNLAGGPVSWAELPPPYRTNGSDLRFIDSAPFSHRFFRLHHSDIAP